MNKMFRSLLAVATVTTLAQQAVAADRTVMSHVPAKTQSALMATDLRDAVPMIKRASVLPSTVFDLNGAAETARTTVPGAFVPGAAPKLPSSFSQLLPAPDLDASTNLNAITPDAVGTGGLQFTSSRMYGKKWWKVWPTTAIGRLLFKIGSSTYTCTGTTIRPGIVLTAGHCVHSGNGTTSGWYTDFTFLPGYDRGGSTRTWTNTANVYVASDWFFGGGSVPNAHDFAIIVFEPNKKGKVVGDYTGYLGYQTNDAIGKHLSISGYPCNLDSCERLHMVNAMGTDYGSLNNVTYGSDMGGGSSGSSVVKNFRANYTDSTTPPSDNNGNLAVAVLSWGYIDESVEVQGGSILDSVFVTMMNTACSTYSYAC